MVVDKAFFKDLMWGEGKHSEFLKLYRDQWVAISNKKVIAFGDNLGQVKRMATKKTGKIEVPVVFVECGEHIYAQS